MKIQIVTKTIQDESELIEVVTMLKPYLSGRDVVLLEGEMGVGKTHFVKAWLGDPQVNSPTFAFHNEYRNSRKIIDHWDLYRTKSDEEVEALGFYDQFEKTEALIFVEWPPNSFEISQDWRQFTVQILKVPGQDSAREFKIQILN